MGRHRLASEESEIGSAVSPPVTPRRLLLEAGGAWVAAWLVGVGFGLALRPSASWRTGAEWERALLGWMDAHPLPSPLDQTMLIVPYVGTNLTLLPVMIAVGLWLWRRRGNGLLAIQLVTVCAGSLALNVAMKYTLGRPRPELYPARGIYNWASYPSGHAILSLALFFTIALVLLRARGWRWPMLAALLIVIATCYSRLYLQVHWPTDVIGGLLIGSTWLFGTWVAFERRRTATQQGATMHARARPDYSARTSGTR